MVGAHEQDPLKRELAEASEPRIRTLQEKGPGICYLIIYKGRGLPPCDPDVQRPSVPDYRHSESGRLLFWLVNAWLSRN